MKFVKEPRFIILFILLLLIIFYIFLENSINSLRHFSIFNKIGNFYKGKPNKRKKKVHFGGIELKIVDKDIPVKDIFI